MTLENRSKNFQTIINIFVKKCRDQDENDVLNSTIIKEEIQATIKHLKISKSPAWM